MRKVHFISPIDYIQGAIATRQTGVVAASGVSTYAGGDVDKELVTGFKQELICHLGSKGVTRGKQWYAIRSKMSYTRNPRNQKALAVFGGSCSMYKAIIEDVEIYAPLVTAFQDVKDKYNSFRQYVVKPISNALFEKESTISFEGATVKVNNPWVSGGTGEDVTIPQAIKDKFQRYLA